MQQLLDVIFSNIFILIAILAALSGLFGNRSKDAENDRPRPVFREQPERTTTIEQNQPTEMRSTIDRDVTPKADEVSIDTSNEWYAQLEQSRERLEKSLTENEGTELDGIKKGSIYKKDRPAVSSISVRNSLNNRRLVESLIMSEVLQKPKAKRENRV